MTEVFSAKDMAQTSPKGSRKKATIQKVPGSAKIQKTAGFLRQLSKIATQPPFDRRTERPIRAAREKIDYARDIMRETRRGTQSPRPAIGQAAVMRVQASSRRRVPSSPT